MEEDGDLTQVTMSQRMADKPSTSLRPNHNYSANPSPSSGKVTSFQHQSDAARSCPVLHRTGLCYNHQNSLQSTGSPFQASM